MNPEINQLCSQQSGISLRQVTAVIKLLEEGATIPFISRYRKEMTGSLDEVQIEQIKKVNEKLTDLAKRKETILSTIEEQGKLTADLRKEIEECWESNVLEDLYLPYKPKRKTKGSVAIEKGLEPLAKILMAQNEPDIESRANAFITKEVEDVASALQGARDIAAEWINENAWVRNRLRRLYDKEAMISSKVGKDKEEDGKKYLDYFEYAEQLKRIPSHRMLAVFRGENEGFLKARIDVDEKKAIGLIENSILKPDSTTYVHLIMAIKDSYKRLIQPSLETEFRNAAKEKADEEAIAVFAKNLRQLLLEPPLGQKRVLAIDPGYRTGCKLVCLDEQGNLEHNQNIYPHGQEGDWKMASKQLKTLVSSFRIEAIAIGNGTASRETEDLVRSIAFDRDIKAFVVSEDGASVYSASEVAREEFEKYDVTVRGAVSIGRRLMDPLAELVKIDPKSIGVGQYQHDVNQNYLKQSLDTVTESCVNQVGVNLNTASKQLLTYVSGLGPQLAQNIVDYRKEKGAFTSREELKKVKRMGEKAFEQSAGFLRIRHAANPLDNTAVHPESYHIVELMAKDLGTDVTDLIMSKELQKNIQIKNYVTDTVGIPTLQDILKELAKPGVDPRQQIKVFEFDKNVRKMDDLIPGMILPGIVTNITKFGAFVDVGVKQDGLVHISELCKRFISDPNEVVSLHQHVKVKVLSVDFERKRLSFSMKQAEI